MDRLAAIQDRHDLQQFILYSQQVGAISRTFHENWYYSLEQVEFFRQYERQLDPVFDIVCQLADLVKA